jgi:hypothetical protein
VTLSGMFISGFIVRSDKPVEGEPLIYGLFSTVESALAWSDKMTVPTQVEAVYTPSYNRG